MREFLVIVGLQDVPVFGHHEDRDEVDNSKSQKLSLLTVLLKQTKPTKENLDICPIQKAKKKNQRSSVDSEVHPCLCCTTHDISEDNSPESVYVHVLKEPVKVSDWGHATCHCINRTLKFMKFHLLPAEMYHCHLHVKCKHGMHVCTNQDVCCINPQAGWLNIFGKLFLLRSCP